MKLNDADLTLLAAYTLIQCKEDWTVGAFARDAQGNRAGSTNDDAVCWCAQGSVDAVAPTEKIGVSAVKRLNSVARELGENAISLNDTLGHAKVLQMFELAIGTTV